ncbi:MAG: glycosyltransferase family 2 protein [Rufibacter sp.]
MVSELSILIPVYNRSVLPLVDFLRTQLNQLAIPAEIRVYDDGSTPDTKAENRLCRNWEQVVYRELPENVGRSKIRYTLAQDAAYQSLLFLDNDVLPTQNDFLQTYVQQAREPVVVGGVTYAKACPPENVLRWKYGREREQAAARQRQTSPYQRVFFSNLLVQQPVFLAYFEPEVVAGYGHEDTLFAYQLQKNQVKVQHLDNGVVHLGLEPADMFLLKTDQALYNLVQLQRKNLLPQESQLSQAYQKLKSWKLNRLLLENSSWLLPILKKNLVGKHPRLRLFDLYRLLLLARYQHKA